MNNRCLTCGSENRLVLDTYKRFWYCCRDCGSAESEQKGRYPLSFLPFDDLKKGVVTDEEKMYDYFVDPVHINWSIEEGKEFIDDYLDPAQIDVQGKRLLDISGGNGHFIKQIEKLGAEITLTEFNKKTVDYARNEHGFEVFEYNLNEDDLAELTGRKFDLVFARACLMFAKDLSKFIDEMSRLLEPGGQILINHSVIPTLGVMLRTQYDEFSYFVLRQPDSIINEFLKKGFKLDHRADETDPSLYVYDNDLLPHWRYIHRFYESKNLKRLKDDRNFALPARDRRRSTLVFSLPK